MRNGLILSTWFVFVLIAAGMMACGSNSGLRTLTISPSTADAQDFANGQVQFTANGTYAGSSQTAPVNVMWWNSEPWKALPSSAPTPPPGFFISTDGLAACSTSGPLSGTFTVWATAPVDPMVPASQMTAKTKQLTATAQLTCP